MDQNNDHSIHANVAELRRLLIGMRSAYARGGNAMAYARQTACAPGNSTLATLIAYDLQAGTYITAARENPEKTERWCQQLADIINPYMNECSSILEVGCGEATTFAGVLKHLNNKPKYAIGFDISWSRCAVGQNWLAENDVSARLFVADLFNIPLEDDSVDIVYTSHSIEPNGGREEDAIRELMRIARCAVVLIEPIYELAGAEAQDRMRHHGYVRGLKETAERVGAKVADYRLLERISNPLNPSGLIVIEMEGQPKTDKACKSPGWRCPLTYTPLSDANDVFLSRETGLAYPVVRSIPLLRQEHAVVASGLIPSDTESSDI
jgi:SAM-dependent methyltransferase